MMKQFCMLAWAGLACATLMASPAAAQTELGPATSQQTATWADVVQVGYQIGTTHGLPTAPPGEGVGAIPLPGYGQVMPQNYPRPKAGLYPSPVQNTPSWHLQTAVTNQAFAPHEMLYPHKYRSMYGPFYYRVHGETIWTPFGPRTHERWKLEGTEVEVKYHDRIKLFSGFHAPRGSFHLPGKL